MKHSGRDFFWSSYSQSQTDFFNICICVYVFPTDPLWAVYFLLQPQVLYQRPGSLRVLLRIVAVPRTLLDRDLRHYSWDWLELLSQLVGPNPECSYQR